MQDIIVTGGAGFIGKYVARQFSEQGFQVHGLGHGSLSDNQMRAWGFKQWHSGGISVKSLLDASKDIQPSVIVQCAGSSSVQFSYDAPYDDFHRTVDTTANILEFSRRLTVPPRVVLISSAAIYGDQGDFDMVETARANPISPYGLNKLMAEKMCCMYSNFFKIQISVVRLFSVYGEGLRKQLLWDAMCKFKKGEYKFFGTGHELRDWIHVEDAARLIYLAAIKVQDSHEIYNGVGTQAANKDILSRLAHAYGFPNEPIFNNETHTGNPRRLTGSQSYVSERLKWAPEISLDSGIRRYVKWFEEENHK